MRALEDYIEAAREKLGVKSYRQLAMALNLDPAGVSAWRTRRAWPTDEHMIKLAEAAGMDPVQAVLELAYWRAASRDETRAAGVYKKLWEHVTHAAAALLIGILFFSAMPNDARADGTFRQLCASEGAGSIYYATTFRRFFRRLLAKLAPMPITEAA